MQNLRLKYGDVELPIQDGYEIQKSSGNVSYNDFVCGWEYTLEDLPSKYQEVQIVDIDTNQVKAFGYVDTFDFGEMRETDVERDINISLLSPMTITTIRTAIATGTYNLIELLRNIILAPLVSDGFTIETIDIPDHQVTVNFQIETIEYCMSNLANKFNFWWFIDENKKIYIKDIEAIKKETPKYIYDDQNRIRGLQYIKPITTSDDYANVVNLKNLRTYQNSRFTVEDGSIVENQMGLITKRITSLKKGEEILFEHAVDIRRENIIRCADNKNASDKIAFSINVIYNDNSTDYATIYVSRDNVYHQTGNLSIEGSNEPKTFDLIQDSFFSNLIVGFRYNGENTIKEITNLKSDTALVWNENKFYNNKGIEDKKGKISNTGIVEITVDMKGTWKTKQEVVEIAKNYLYKNDYNFADKLELQTDEDIFSIGDLIKINKFGIDDVYVVTDITEKFSKMDSEYIVKTQKSNNIGNFVDTFRQEPEQEDEGRNYQVYVTHYNNDEIWQTTEVVI